MVGINIAETPHSAELQVSITCNHVGDPGGRSIPEAIVGPRAIEARCLPSDVKITAVTRCT